MGVSDGDLYAGRDSVPRHIEGLTYSLNPREDYGHLVESVQP